MPVGFRGTILQCGGIGRLEEVCAIEEGFGALCEERRRDVAIREERREDVGVNGTREGDQRRRRCHGKGDLKDWGGENKSTNCLSDGVRHLNNHWSTRIYPE